MPMDFKENAVPSGSIVADNSGEEVRQPSQEASSEAPANQDGNQQQGQEDSGQGQEGSGQEDFAAKLAAKLDDLNSSIKNMGTQPQGDPQGQGSQEPARDYDSELAELQTQAENGDISYNELIAKSQAIHEAKTQDMVRQEIGNYHHQQQTQSLQDRFLSENPGFESFVGSPENQAMQQANPVLDNVSAFYANEAHAAKAQVAELQAQLTALQQQREQAVGNAAGRQAQRVGTEPGTDVRQTASQPNQNMSARDSMMAVLKSMRAGQ